MTAQPPSGGEDSFPPGGGSSSPGPYVPPPGYGPPPPYGPPPGYGPPTPYGPQPMAPQDERTWGMLAHLSFVALAVIAPLIIMLVFGPRSRFVRGHAVEALNFHLTLLIVWVVGGIAGLALAVATVGIALVVLIPLAVAAGLLSLVWSVMACVDAWHGRPYRYPVSIRMVS